MNDKFETYKGEELLKPYCVEYHTREELEEMGAALEYFRVFRWVSVGEVLPCIGELVLAIVNGVLEKITFHDAVQLARYIPGEGWIIESYPEWKNAEVTHWMQIPEFHGGYQG